MTNTDKSSVFEIECLRAHNDYRALHGCPPLKINSNLTKEAQAWAQSLLNNNKLEHSQKPGLGENLYMGSGFNVTGDMPVKAWYDEIKDYNYSLATFLSATGHFTQVIWKNSTDLGVAAATRNNTTYVVANYTPPGNVLGRFKKNVPPKSIKGPIIKVASTDPTTPQSQRRNLLFTWSPRNKENVLPQQSAPSTSAPVPTEIPSLVPPLTSASTPVTKQATPSTATTVSKEIPPTKDKNAVHFEKVYYESTNPVEEPPSFLKQILNGITKFFTNIWGYFFSK